MNYMVYIECTVKSLIWIAPNPNLNRLSSCLPVVFVQYIEAEVENEDVVGEAPTGDAPTTSDYFGDN